MVEMELRGVQAVVGVLERVARVDPAAPLEEIGIYLHRRAIEGFQAQRDPWGVAWHPLSPETVQRKGSDRILEDTGRLRQSIAWRLIGRDAVAVGTNVEYAPYHQSGTHAIPRRPFLPIAEDGRPALPEGDLRAIMSILGRYYGFSD